MNLNIVPYSSKDETAVDQLFLELQTHEHQFDDHKSTQFSNAHKYKNEVLESIQTKQGELLVARVDNVIVGLVAWYIEEEYEFDSPYGYISDIIVSKEYRGRGIGKQLLETAISHLKNTEVKRIHIGVLLSNSETKKFYAKNGFVPYLLQLTKDI